jgi:hypothetical protein
LKSEHEVQISEHYPNTPARTNIKLKISTSITSKKFWEEPIANFPFAADWVSYTSGANLYYVCVSQPIKQ